MNLNKLKLRGVFIICLLIPIAMPQEARERQKEGRGRKEEGRGRNEEARGRKKEGRGRSEEGRVRKKEGQRRNEENRGRNEEGRGRNEDWEREEEALEKGSSSIINRDGFRFRCKEWQEDFCARPYWSPAPSTLYGMAYGGCNIDNTSKLRPVTSGSPQSQCPVSSGSPKSQCKLLCWIATGDDTCVESDSEGSSESAKGWTYSSDQDDTNCDDKQHMKISVDSENIISYWSFEKITWEREANFSRYKCNWKKENACGGALSQGPQLKKRSTKNVKKKGKKKFDIIIVGGGAVGLSTAYHLANTNKKVLVLEKFGFFNNKGSSAGMSRQFRFQYSQKYMSELALAARSYYDELQKHTDTELINTCGSLWFGDPATASQEGGIAQAMEVMDELGISYEHVDAKQIEDQYHFKNIKSDYSGFFQRDGGIINLQATLEAMYNVADDADNITLMEHTQAENIYSLANGKIIVETAATKFICEKLILTPGAHVNQLLQHLGLWINLDIWEMSSAYYKKTEADINYPTWFAFQEPQNTSLFYGFPEVDWSHPGYIRVAPDIPDRILNDPKLRSGKPSKKSLTFTNKWVKQHMEGLEPTPEFTSTCLISLSHNPKKELLLDFAPEWVHNNENIIVYTAGWAAKFIPLLGSILKDLALDGKTEYDISNFKISWQDVRSEVSKNFVTDMQDDLKLDVAIVGAGASGLYSGYRLLTGKTEEGNKLDLSVNIFEMSERVGGRLMSVQLPGMNIAAELGGMRYMNEQQIVTALIEDIFSKQYGLNPIKFPMGDPDHHLFYLRKQRFFANQFSQTQITGEKFKTRYFVEKENEGKSSDDIFNEIAQRVLKADGFNLTVVQHGKDARKTWNEIKQKLKYNFEGPYNGLYVYEIGFWNLIKDQTSQECYEFLAQAGGYYSNTINWNAAEAFPYMVGDFADSAVEYKTIEGGFDQILTSLASSFIQEGGTIWTKNSLETFKRNRDPNSEYKYVLTIYNHDSGNYWTVYAKDIILGMPRRSLELLDQYNFFFNRYETTELQYKLESVINEPALKILLGFEEPWWKDAIGAMAGESITDLPMRQCYYFGVDPENSHSLFLASYNDMRTIPFWQALHFGEPYKQKKTRLVRGGEFVNPPFEQASQVMVEEVMKQVRELHGPEVDIPKPYTSAYKDWSDDPYGGGYHAWRAGSKVWDVMPYIRQPKVEERIFIVGEAYSDQQGWVEGAFCVTEHILREKYNLTCPEWLDEDYYLGW